MISPQIIITGHGVEKKISPIIARALQLVEERFLEMDIKILIPHTTFSYEELLAWIQDVSSAGDFLLNISLAPSLEVSFAQQNEEDIASQIVVNIAQRLSLEPTPAQLQKTEISPFPFPALYQWNIGFPDTILEKQLMLNVMACITDMYTLKHALLPENLIWPFRDVASSHFAFDAIKKAKAKKVIAGYKGEIFYPNGGITRGEVLYILDKLGLL